MFNQLITAESVIAVLEKSCSPIAVACFRAECCLHGLSLHGKTLSPEAVLASYPPNGQQQKNFFNRQCCLNGLKVHGNPVSPEQVVHDYEKENQLLEKAVFLSELALRARQFNGREITPEQVLEAYNQLPADYSILKVAFLIQRLTVIQDVAQEAAAVLEQAWRIIDSPKVQNEQHRYQRCTLMFLALSIGLPLCRQPVTTAQVWQSIGTLRDSFDTTRLRFYFLAHCFNTHATVDGQPVMAQQVLDCLAQLPVSKLRRALSVWFEETCRKNVKSAPTEMRANIARQPKRIEVYIDKLGNPGPYPCEVVEYFPPRTPPLTLSAHCQKVLNIVQTIDHLRITGSFARCLQNLGSSFNDIDLLGTDEAINTLISRLSSQFGNHLPDTEIPCKISTLIMLGCPLLKLPKTYSIALTEGDFGVRLLVLQANVLPTKTLAALDCVDLPVSDTTTLNCLPFHVEVQLLNTAVQFLDSNLDALITQLQTDDSLSIPRTILFNYPRHPQERIFGLMMRCLLTLNKARQFCQLSGTRHDFIAQGKLREISRRLLIRLRQHSLHEPFVAAIRQRLTPAPGTPQHSNHTFVRSLLELMIDPVQPF